MTRSKPGLAVKVDQRAKLARFTANNCNHQGKAKRTGAGKGSRRATNSNPNGKRILHRAGIDRLSSEWRAMLAGPADV
jgi:hypothetical protein